MEVVVVPWAKAVVVMLVVLWVVVQPDLVNALVLFPAIHGALEDPVEDLTQVDHMEERQQE
jgi:hypothetical protein